jgi:hypothetical protein
VSWPDFAIGESHPPPALQLGALLIAKPLKSSTARRWVLSLAVANLTISPTSAPAPPRHRLVQVNAVGSGISRQLHHPSRSGAV